MPDPQVQPNPAPSTPVSPNPAPAPPAPPPQPPAPTLPPPDPRIAGTEYRGLDGPPGERRVIEKGG
jgi:hypothetical protein